MFIELTPNYGDHKLYVQPCCIAMVKQEKAFTKVWLTGGTTIEIQEELKEVIDRINGKKKWQK